MSDNTAPWVPWDIPKNGPPCTRCRFWRPQFRYVTLPNGTEIDDGIQLCHAIDMQHDFSCFVDRAR